MNVKKLDLLVKMRKDSGLDLPICNAIFATMVKVIGNNLCSGEGVSIVRFGKFRVQKKKQRWGLNPKTKEKHIITERRIVKLRPSNLFKDKC